MSSEEALLGGRKVDGRPEHIGPGYWDCLAHIARCRDTTSLPNARETFIDDIVRGVGGHFKCLHCREHALEYMTHTDPIRNILRMPKFGPDGTTLMICSAWLYRFHEVVNERLKKPREQRPTFLEHEKYLDDLESGKGCHNCGPVAATPVVTTEKPVRGLKRQVSD
jgi:hypothetical protein